MKEFEKYESMRADGIDAGGAYATTKEEGLDQLTAIRMLREIYGLSLVEAKKVSFEVDTGHSSEKSQPGLEQQFTDGLDDLLGD